MDEQNHGGVADELQEEGAAEELQADAKVAAEEELASLRPEDQETATPPKGPISGPPLPADQPGVGRAAEPPEVEAPSSLGSSRRVSAQDRLEDRRLRQAA